MCAKYQQSLWKAETVSCKRLIKINNSIYWDTAYIT